MNTIFFHLGLGDVPEVCVDPHACKHGYPINRHTLNEGELLRMYGIGVDDLPEVLQKSR